MNLTITIDGSDQIVNFDSPDGMSLLDVKAYLESETNIARKEQVLVVNNKVLDNDSQSLEEQGVSDGDLLLLRRMTAAPAATAPVDPTAQGNDARNMVEQVRQHILRDPQTKQLFLSNSPDAEAILNDSERFFQEYQRQYQANMAPGGRQMPQIHGDPYSEENQKKIMEMIQQSNIDENLEKAYELTPESFTQVDMLYVDVEVNGHPVKAFVDSGAQQTIISPQLAEKCELSRLVDRRFQGTAVGVGSTPILGRVHSAPIKIGGVFAPCSFTVLDAKVDMLLGLDMLRRHQGVINLRKNVLEFAGGESPFVAPPPKDDAVSQQLGGNIFSPGSMNPTPQQQASVNAQARQARERAQQAISRPAQPTPTPTPTPAVTADPTKLRTLVEMGFPESQAREALITCNNNVDLAAGLLFGP